MHLLRLLGRPWLCTGSNSKDLLSVAHAMVLLLLLLLLSVVARRSRAYRASRRVRLTPSRLHGLWPSCRGGEKGGARGLRDVGYTGGREGREWSGCASVSRVISRYDEPTTTAGSWRSAVSTGRGRELSQRPREISVTARAPIAPSTKQSRDTQGRTRSRRARARAWGQRAASTDKTNTALDRGNMAAVPALHAQQQQRLPPSPRSPSRSLSFFFHQLADTRRRSRPLLPTYANRRDGKVAKSASVRCPMGERIFMDFFLVKIFSQCCSNNIAIIRQS
jgi:hypothetical protein